MNCVPVGHRGASNQSSLRDSGALTRISLPSDKSLGYYHSSLRDEQPTSPSCKTPQQNMRHVKIVENAFPKWLICGMGLAATCPSVLIYSVVMLSLLVVGFTTPEELGDLHFLRNVRPFGAGSSCFDRCPYSGTSSTASYSTLFHFWRSISIEHSQPNQIWPLFGSGIIGRSS